MCTFYICDMCGQEHRREMCSDPTRFYAMHPRLFTYKNVLCTRCEMDVAMYQSDSWLDGEQEDTAELIFLIESGIIVEVR